MQEKKQQTLVENIQAKAGFSLVEVLVVATIIIVLATLGMVSYRAASRSTKEAKCKSDLETVRQALVMYRSEEGTYQIVSASSTWVDLVAALQAEDYLADGDDFSPQDPTEYNINLLPDSFTLSAALGDCGGMQVENP